MFLKTLYIISILSLSIVAHAQRSQPKYHVLGFYTAKNDAAHINFVHEANEWFSKVAKSEEFIYDSTNDWNKMNDENLNRYQIVVFLDTRPDSLPQRLAFEKFAKNGGGWIGFHFAGFALTPSSYPQNWNWYHEEFLGSGEYRSNTWRPTSVVLKVEQPANPITKNLGKTFIASPNEWYSWKNDLRTNPSIHILLSIDSTSFPVGTGPKQHEIWQSGYYPVAWTNKNYHMLYVNMGHNDIDYDHGRNEPLSHTFGNLMQDQLILNALRYFGKIRVN